MRFLSFRNPKGFRGLFLILMIYVALTGIVVQFFDSTILQRIYVLVSLLVLGWASWTILSILSTSSEEEDDDLQSKDE